MTQIMVITRERIRDLRNINHLISGGAVSIDGEIFVAEKLPPSQPICKSCERLTDVIDREILNTACIMCTRLDFAIINKPFRFRLKRVK